MYGSAIAAHINQNMAAQNLSAKHVAAEAKVPESTLSNYRTGKVDKPNEEQVLRIFAVWGDGPDALYNIRRQVDETARAEALLKARAKDTELIDQITGIIREGSIQMLKQYSELNAAQQTEILQHADRRVDEERSRCAALNASVLKQCQEETDRVKKACAREIELVNESCDKRLAMIEQHYEARLSDAKAHLTQLIEAEHAHGSEMRDRFGASREYLKSSVRNLAGSCILLAMTSLFFGAYAIFAYTTFDMKDPTRGLHRDAFSMGPVMLALSVSLIAIAGSRIVILFLNRPSKKAKEEEK